MTTTHVALICGFLAATAAMLMGLTNWHDALHPTVIGAFLAQLATVIGGIYSDKPGQEK